MELLKYMFGFGCFIALNVLIFEFTFKVFELM
jgi:hypothetical protein